MTGGNETVLVVEDDEEVRLTVIDILGEFGYRVLKAPDATAALVVLRASPVDIIVSDVELPGMSGVALAVQARSLRQDIRIVFATGKNSLPARELDALGG